MKPIRSLKREDMKQAGFLKATKVWFVFAFIVFGLALAILLPAGSALDITPPDALLGSNLYNESGLFIGGAIVEFDGYVNDSDSGLLNWSIELYNSDESLNATICSNDTSIPINGTLCTWDTESVCPAEDECGNFTVNLTAYDVAENPSAVTEDNTIFPVYIDNIYPEIGEDASFDLNYGEDGTFWTAEFETSDNHLAAVRGFTLDSGDYVVTAKGYLCNETQGDECNGPGSGTFLYDWHLDSYTLNDTAVPVYYKFNFGLNESNDWYLATVPGCIEFNDSTGYDCGQEYDVCTAPDTCIKQYRWWLVYNMSAGIDAIGTLIGITQENYCPEGGTCLIDDTSIENETTNFTTQSNHYDGNGSWTIENTSEITLYDVGDSANVNLTYVEPTGDYSFLVQSDDYFWTSDSLWENVFVGAVCGDGVGTCNCGDTIYTDYTFGGDLNCSSEGMDALYTGADDITIDCAGNSIIGNDSDIYVGFTVANSGVTIQNCNNISSFSVGIAALSNSDLNFINNTVDMGTNGSIGIAEVACDGSTIENNTIIDNSLADINIGIYLNGLGITSDHHITNNTIIQNCGTTCIGIEALSEDNNVIQNNNITSNYLGILLFNSNNISITSNNISITGEFGGGSIESLSGLSIADIKNIYGSGNGEWNINGISINNGFPLITGILIEAIEPELGGDNIISGNTISGAIFGGIVSATERNTLADNSINCSDGFSGIYLTGSQIGEEPPVTAEDNYLSGNEIFGGAFGVYADGDDETYDLNNFTIDGDNYHDSAVAGLYLDNVGTEEIRPTITNSDIRDNCQGTYLESSFAIIENTNYIDNNAALCPPEAQLGLGVDGDSTAYIINGNFTNNSNYGIYDGGPNSVYVIITGDATCKNNLVSIANGGIEFDGGTLRLDNCSIEIGGGSQLNFTANITSVDFSSGENITGNESTELNFVFSEPNTNITLYLNDNVTTTIAVGGQTPASAPAGLEIFTGIIIETTDDVEGNLTWALIKIFYNQAELNAAGIAESSLKIYFYNDTTQEWQLEPDQDVDMVNDYVWANVTHLSQFGVFGTSIAGHGPSNGPTSLRTFGGVTNVTTEMPNVTTEACTPDWSCTSSTECINGKMTRTCTDLNNCGTTAGKPAEITNCITKENQQKLAIAIGVIIILAVAVMLLRHKKR